MKRKNLFSAFWAMVLAGVLFTAAVPSNVFAAGTTAGTVISAQATVQYTDGTNVRNKTSNSVTLKVNQIIAATYDGATMVNDITYTGADQEGLDSRTVIIPLNFTNTGNQGDWFKVTFSMTSGTGYSNLRLVEDVGSTVGSIDGTDNVRVADDVTSQFAVGTSNKLLLAFDVDASRTDMAANSISVTLTSQSAFGSATYPSAGGADPKYKNKAFTYTVKYTVKKPVFTYSITQTVPTIPGSAGNWAITYKNAGHNPVKGTSTLTISLPDILMGSASPSGVTGVTAVYTPTLSYPVGAVTKTYGGSIAVSIPEANVTNSDQTVTLPFYIEQISNNGTGPASASNSTITTSQFATTYTGDAGNPNIYTANPSAIGGTALVTVQESKGAQWDLFTSPEAGAGETFNTKLSVKNMGNTAVRFQISQADGTGGTYNNIAHTFSLTNAVTGAAPMQTSVINPGASGEFYVILTTPTGFKATETIQSNLTVAPLSGATGTTATGLSSDSETKLFTTTFNGTTLSVELTCNKNNAAPTEVVEYTLTLVNGKSSPATGVIITLPIDVAKLEFMTDAYGVGKNFAITDGTNPITEPNVVFTSPNITTGTGITVPANGTVEIKYQCTVK